MEQAKWLRRNVSSFDWQEDVVETKRTCLQYKLLQNAKKEYSVFLFEEIEAVLNDFDDG